MLTKNSIVTFVPGSPGIPGDPGEAAHPAYCSTERVTEQVWVGSNILCYSGVDSITGEPRTVCYAVGGHYENQTHDVTTCYPASGGRPPAPPVPATPAQWVTNHQIGWNAGAHSITLQLGDLRATFKVPSASGVVIGLNRRSLGVGFAEIRHGFFFRRGLVQVYESGVERTLAAAFDPEDVFTIDRIGGNVRYYQGTTLLYASAVPSLLEAILDCSLYTGGDRID